MTKSENKINILGTDYVVNSETEAENPGLKGNAGLSEVYSKRIVLDMSERYDDGVVENIDAYYHRVLRHEAIHAFFFETGLSKYYEDEDLVEALAILYPKLKTLMENCDKFDLNRL